MTAQLKIAFKNMPASAWVEQLVTEQLEKLERMYADTIISCRVTAQVPHKHRHLNNDFEVSLYMHVRDHEVVVNRKSTHDVNAHAVITQAFEAAKRQLDDWVQVSRGYVKRHGESPRRMEAAVPATPEEMLEATSPEVG